MFDEMTFQQFGYHLSDLAPGSHKKVVCVCPACTDQYVTQRRYYIDNRLCAACTSKQMIAINKDKDAAIQALEKHNQASREQGVSPRRLPLFSGNRLDYWKQYGAMNRERYNELQRTYRQTPIGKLSNRLRVAVRKYLQGKGGFSQLHFTPAELQAHIQTKLEERRYLCPMCGDSLEDGFDIDHRTPLSSAKTIEEVIVLFALSNLDVLCSVCNQHKKRAKRIEY
jgi:hypothetical protein